jgi:flagellar export protein FliJ
MKRFQFSMQKVLNLRMQELRQAERGLVLAIEAEEVARRILRDAESHLAFQTARASERENGPFTAAAFSMLRKHLAYLGRQVQALALQWQGANERVVEARAAVREAHQRLKTLERLRERRYTEYLLAHERAEQMALDEFAARQGLNRPPLFFDK